MELTFVQNIAIYAIPLIFAITLHEVAHGWVAAMFGDQTARMMGRLSLNPVRHIDLVGTIIVPILMLTVSNFVFGWAKPVPVNPRNMRHPRRDMVFVALAGPTSNLLMALFWACIAKASQLLIAYGYDWLGIPLELMGGAGININIVLAVLNLLPLPPLDGGNILLNVLPGRISYRLVGLENYGFIILMLLLMTGILSKIMVPPIIFLLTIIYSLFGL